MDALLERQVFEALHSGALSEVAWNIEDDLCDCIYQRIGFWTNPYIGETLEIRLCCVWSELAEQYPDAIRTTHAFKNYNTGEWVEKAAPWNGEFDMPKSIWYRQLAHEQGRSLPDIRTEYADKDHLRPRGIVKKEPIPFYIGDYLVDLNNWTQG